MYRNTSNTASPEDYKIKLQALREKLQTGKESPIIENFDGDLFIALMHEKYVSCSS